MTNDGITNSCPLCNDASKRVAELEAENAELREMAEHVTELAIEDDRIYSASDGFHAWKRSNRTGIFPILLDAYRALKEAV